MKEQTFDFLVTASAALNWLCRVLTRISYLGTIIYGLLCRIRSPTFWWSLVFPDSYLPETVLIQNTFDWVPSFCSVRSNSCYAHINNTTTLCTICKLMPLGESWIKSFSFLWLHCSGYFLILNSDLIISTFFWHKYSKTFQFRFRFPTNIGWVTLYMFV